MYSSIAIYSIVLIFLTVLSKINSKVSSNQEKKINIVVLFKYNYNQTIYSCKLNCFNKKKLLLYTRAKNAKFS